MKKLFMRPCPFCMGDAGLYVCDGEGNIHDENYENDPWSGLSYKIRHTVEDDKTGTCPIATDVDFGVGMWYYDTKEEAVESWNGPENKNEIVDNL